MYNINRTSIYKNLKTKCYIASKVGTYEDENGNEIPEYKKPEKFIFNIQPVNSDSEIRTFGELAPRMKVAVLTERNKYDGVFKEFDLAYLDGASPSNEIINGDNANYRIYAVQPQNMIIKVYFIKLVK